MRLWSLHPALLDRQGLLACWREGLLAQAVLLERTRGYRNHPQLHRFQACPDPAAAVGTYLSEVAVEASARGYRFDATRIARTDDDVTLTVTAGQVEYEVEHLIRKLLERNPDLVARVDVAAPRIHPLFRVVPGAIEPWERLSA